MEARFGQDFSRVRVHSDGRAAVSAREVGAHAYTVGHDIVFGSGRYQPGSPGGRSLLAHELTHVVQQQDAVGADAPTSTAADHPLERQAAEVAAGGRFTARLSVRRPVLSRQDAAPAGSARAALAEIQGLPMSELLSALEMLPFGVRSDERAGQAVGGPRLVTAMRVVAAGGGAWLPFKTQHDSELATLPPDQVSDIGAYLQAHDVGGLRTTIPAIAVGNIRANWASRKQDFLAAAGDPSNTLGSGQLYQIWLRYWMDEQAAARAEFEPLDAVERSDLNRYSDKLPKFRAGIRGVFSPGYEAASDRLTAANYFGSYLIGVRDWLETYVDDMHRHVTLEEVNRQAVVLIKAREFRLAILNFVIALAGGPLREAAPQPGKGVNTGKESGRRAPDAPETVLVKDDPAIRARALAQSIGAKGEEVVANLGGAGASHEPKNAINVNNQAVSRKDIPNLVEADGSDIGSLFEPDTIDRVEGHNMAPGVIDWERAAPGSFRVLRSGGRFRYYWRGANADAQACAKALKAAGFADVTVHADVLVTARKP